MTERSNATIHHVTAQVREGLDRLRALGPAEAEQAAALHDEMDAHLRHIESLADAQADAIVHAAEHGIDLLEAKVRAEQTAKVKSDFLASMSHELRTPLHAVLTFARLGVRKGADLPQRKAIEYLRRIETSGNLLLNLVGNLLDLARLEGGPVSLLRHNVDVAALTRAVVDEFAITCEDRGVTVALDVADECVLAGDEAKLAQVLRNVLSNAIKYSPRGCRIELAWRATDGETLRFTCRDTGPGIPAPELTTIFERFRQSSLRPAGVEGTGLGLTIAQEIVALHDGRIQAANHPDGGAVFSVDLPIAAAAKTASVRTV